MVLKRRRFLLDAAPALAVATRSFVREFLSESLTPHIVSTADVLRATDPAVVHSGAAQTLGALAAGDGGGGLWRWVSRDSRDVGRKADNTGTVIASSIDDTGQWVRQINGPINVMWFGAVPDGTTDSRPAMQAAMDYAHSQGGGEVIVPAGKYYLAAPLLPRSAVYFHGEGYGTVLRVRHGAPGGSVFYNADHMKTVEFARFCWTPCGTLSLGQRTITAPGHSFEAGDLGFLSSTNSISFVVGSTTGVHYEFSQIVKVIRVNGDELTLESGLDVAYGAAQISRTAVPGELIDRFQLSDMTLQSTWCGLRPQAWYRCKAYNLRIQNAPDGVWPFMGNGVAHAISANAVCECEFFGIEADCYSRCVELKIGSVNTVVRHCKFNVTAVGQYQSPIAGANSFGLLDFGEQARGVAVENIKIDAPGLELDNTSGEAVIVASSGKDLLYRNIDVRIKHAAIAAHISRAAFGSAAGIVMDRINILADTGTYGVFIGSIGTDCRRYGVCIERLTLQTRTAPRYGFYAFDEIGSVVLRDCRLPGRIGFRRTPPLFDRLVIQRCEIDRSAWLSNNDGFVVAEVRQNTIVGAKAVVANQVVRSQVTNVTTTVPHASYATLKVPPGALAPRDAVMLTIFGELFLSDAVVTLVGTDKTYLTLEVPVRTSGSFYIEGRIAFFSPKRAVGRFRFGAPAITQSVASMSSTTIDLNKYWELDLQIWNSTGGRIIVGPVSIYVNVFMMHDSV